MAEGGATAPAADVFISYARENLATAERLVAALEQRGWSVFLDRSTRIGPRFDQHIAGKLRAARCVVVLWSEASIGSEWVIEEATAAKNREVLAPVRLEDVDPPFGFTLRNYADLFGWNPARNHDGFEQLVARVTELAGLPSARAEIPAAYLDWVRRTYVNVDLLGQDADKSHAFQLDHVYVPALTSAPAGEQQLRQDQERRPVPLLQRLNEQSLCVLAQAGAGKSFFSRWAVLRSFAGEDLCHPVPAPEDFVEAVPEKLRGRLPLLVPLRDFAPRTDWGHGTQVWRRKDLEQSLAAWVDTALDDIPGAVLIAHLKAGTAFLLLDGLDELAESEKRHGVTTYPRELLLSGLADALPTWITAGNRVLLTSRPAGMERARLHRLGLETVLLEPLPSPLQDLFVRRWFHTLRKEESADGLIKTIRDREELAPLAENPMLLTALCILYDSGGQLPEDRYRLYRRIVDNVLFHRFPGGTSETEPIKARLEAIALQMNAGNEKEPRTSPAAEVSEFEVDQALRQIADEGWCEEDRRVEPAVRRNELLEKSGLLLPKANQQVEFYHLSFQEYLAAERLLRCSNDDLEAVFQERYFVSEWRLTLLFLFAGRLENTRPDWGSRLLGRMIEEQSRSVVKSNAAPAQLIAEALDLILAKRRPVPSPVKAAFTSLALDAITDEVALPARQALALTLGRLGDPRVLDLHDRRAYVEVPSGTYPYGEKGESVEIQSPFLLGRYPVTNSQYDAFMGDGGYREPKWWSEPGWSWLQTESIANPLYWREQRWNGPNQPVVGVSFWEAEACAAWAGGRLPTEQDWEAAARGRDGFRFPWGNDWVDGICNTLEARLRQTSPVGAFPRSRQAQFDIDDLAGNVWEWSRSLYRTGTPEDETPRVLRGGSWYFDQDYARSANRNWFNPLNRSYSIGFRMVCSSPSTGH